MSFLGPIAQSAATAVGSKLIQKGSKEVVKKKMSKKKKAIIGGAVIVGGKQIIGDDGKTVENTSGAISTSDANAAAMEAAGDQVGASGGSGTLTGLAPGFQIAGGGKAELQKGYGAGYLATLTPEKRAETLLRLGQIPGLYPKGQAPTPKFIQDMINGKDIVPRLSDIAAIDQIAYFSEYSGSTVDNTILKLIAQPQLAQQFFGKVSTVPKAVSSPDALAAELNDKFLDIFETKADAGIIKAYTKEINSLESKGSLGAQQKEDILLKYIQKKATDQFNAAQTGMVPSVVDKGTLGRTVRKIRTAYADNGIPINEKDIYNKAVQSLRSREAEQNILDGVMTQATAVMPAFKDFFAQGKTAREVLSPWISVRSQILGVPADQIKVSDMYDVGSGPVALTIQDYKKQLYRSPEFKKTDAYKERSLGDLQTLLRAFNIG